MNKILVFLSLFLFSFNIYANDSHFGHSGQGIVLKKLDNVAMRKEILTITKDLVTVEYVYENTSDKDIEAEITFPFSQYSQLSYAESAPRNFKLWIEGKKVPVQFKVEKYLFGNSSEDATKTLKGIFKDHGLIFSNLPEVKNLDDKIFNKLKEEKLVETWVECMACSDEEIKNAVQRTMKYYQKKEFHNLFTHTNDHVRFYQKRIAKANLEKVKKKLIKHKLPTNKFFKIKVLSKKKNL